MNREFHSRSCWLILALLVAMLALLVAILSLLLAILSPTFPKMFRNRPRQPPRCLRHPFRASQKCQKPKKTNVFVFFLNVFRFPAHLLKSSKNAPRTAPEAPKLSSKCPSWRYHAPSWRYHGPSLRHHGPSRTRLDAILAPTSIILHPSCAPSSREVPTRAHQRSQEPHQERPRHFEPPIFFDFRPLWI